MLTSLPSCTFPSKNPHLLLHRPYLHPLSNPTKFSIKSQDSSTEPSQPTDDTSSTLGPPPKNPNSTGLGFGSSSLGSQALRDSSSRGGSYCCRAEAEEEGAATATATQGVSDAIPHIEELTRRWKLKINHSRVHRLDFYEQRVTMTRSLKASATINSTRRPALLHLVSAAAIFSLFIFAIQSSFFTGNQKVESNTEEVWILSDFQSSVQQCVANRGLGLTAHIVDHCKLVLKFPKGTNSTWYNAQFKIFEHLEYNYDVCEAVLLWQILQWIQTK